jgi:hypothetical protein
LKAYLTYGVALVVFLGWANHRGWRPFSDYFFAPTHWAPAGRTGFHK